jgi:hypothetical protein
MKHRINRTLFYTLLLAVYGIFFSVESFYNFEGQTNARELIRNASFTHTHHLSVARALPLGSSSHGLRLNKRYHPEAMPACPVFSPAQPVSLVQPSNDRVGGNIHLPSTTRLSYSLRGPPVVA